MGLDLSTSQPLRLLPRARQLGASEEEEAGEGDIRIPRCTGVGSSGALLLCCPLNCRVLYKREEGIVSEALSENAEKLLRQVAALKGDYPDGYVPDHVLWDALRVDPDTYYEAAEELYDKRRVERQGTDFAALRPR